MNVVNYQKELEKIIDTLDKNSIKKKLLLHSCCAPCSSYCLMYLANIFDITVFFYNPNIFPQEEFVKRAGEEIRLIDMLNAEYGYAIRYVEGKYDPETFFDRSRGREREKEGGERCFLCYEQRLTMSAEYGKEHEFDYFTTTLTISPLKSAAKLNEIGSRVGKEFGIDFLPSDFKKKNGYKQSVELSAKYDLYRQNYCGCVFSKRESLEREELKK